MAQGLLKIPDLFTNTTDIWWAGIQNIFMSYRLDAGATETQVRILWSTELNKRNVLLKINHLYCSRVVE
jgi:hypothetical protein